MPDPKPKTVMVNGLGVVQFPASMDDTKIAAAIKAHLSKSSTATGARPHNASVSAYTPTAWDTAKDIVRNTPVLRTAHDLMPKVTDYLGISPNLSDDERKRQQESGQSNELINFRPLTEDLTASHLRAAALALGGPSAETLIEPIAPFLARETTTQPKTLPQRTMTGLAGVASGMTTPGNLSIMALTGGFGKVAKPVLGKLISAGFSAQMIWNLYNQSKEFKTALDKGDYGAAAQIGGEMLGTGTMAWMAGRHAVKDIPMPESVKQFMANEEGSVGSQDRYLKGIEPHKVATEVHDRLRNEGYRVFDLKGGNTGGSRYLTVFPHGDNSPESGITLRFSDHPANVGGSEISEISGRGWDENDVGNYEQAIERLKAKGIKPNPSTPKLPDVKAKAAELKPTTAYKSVDQSQPFYLKSENLINEKMKGPMPAEDVHKMLLSNGVKPEEMKWTGLDELLTGKGKQKVTPQEIQEHLAGNNLQVQEVQKGASAGAKTRDEWARSEYDKPYDQLDFREQRWVDSMMSNGDGLTSSEKTKFGYYVLPGGENYRELLVTMPSQGVTESDIENYFQPGKIVEGYGGKDKVLAFHPSTPQQGWSVDVIHVDDKGNPVYGERARRHSTQPEPQKLGKSQFRSSHWDEPNVVGHVRFNDRTGTNGEKLLHLEELQSDWHQKGRTQGYADSSNQIRTREDAERRGYSVYRAMSSTGKEAYFATGPEIPRGIVPNQGADTEAEAWSNLLPRLQNYDWDSHKVPDAPFKKTWPELLLKRMVRYAAENGYDGISWTPGEQQAERYDLSKQIKEIDYEPIQEPAGTYEIIARDHSNREVLHEDEVPLSRIEEIVGKDVAAKIEKREGEKGYSSGYRDWHRLSGLDLKVGGEGMKGFYDKIIPDAANKLGKQWGAKVGETKISGGGIANFTMEPVGPESTLWEVVSPEGKVVHTGLSKNDAYAKMLEEAMKGEQHTVPYLPITPQMRTGVKSIPFSLFSIPLAAGALSLSQVKAQAEKVKPKMVKVTDPNGHIHTFPNESMAENFKKEAGIQ